MRTPGVPGTAPAGLVLVLLGSVWGCALHPGEISAPRVQPSAQANQDQHGVRQVAGRTTARPLEQMDPWLADALRSVAARPTAANHRRLAGVYFDHGVRDAAFDQFTSALQLDRADALSYEGRARIWRDWGFPDFALGDASRAVFHAPGSASARNTLGTILQRLGRTDDARAAYERAIALDGRADYAMNNLCSLAFDRGDVVSGAALCRRALDVMESNR